MVVEIIQPQTQLQWVNGNPEGQIDGVPGAVVINVWTGTWYRKTTPIGTKTGWSTFSTGAGLSGVTVGSGLPPEDGSVTTLIYKDEDSGIKYVNLGTVSSPDWDAV